MEKEYLLGVDVGTTSIKVAIIDKNAKLLGISSSSYPLITPNQDYVQIDTEGMWQAYLKCIRLLLQGKGISPEKIAGIGISSLCPGLAAMDEKGNILVEPIIYSDRRSTEEAEIIKAAVGGVKSSLILQQTTVWQEHIPVLPCCGLREIYRKFMRKQNILVILILFWHRK